MRIVELNQQTKSNILNDLLKRSPNNYDSYADTVGEIVSTVREKGDEAVFDYTLKFDKTVITKENIEITKEEIDEAYSSVSQELVSVIKRAASNIQEYHMKQKQYSWFDSKPDGTILGQKVTPLSSVGVYVPGGKAAYPSSVLMNVI
ncbi:MAG: histidinol dehydrogenase, partial [Lachnospiraceae bacterium]